MTCPIFRPDHNGECLLCDEWLDAHTPEAIALGETVANALAAQADAERERAARRIVDEALREAIIARDDRETIIHNQLANLGSLRRQLDEATAAAKELAGKIQFLINTVDERGMLPEHVFTFPDGDVWEAKHLDTQLRPSITCPRCGKKSYHPNDISEKYCGACKQFHEFLKREW